MLNQLYPFVLALHNLWRWIALLGVLVAAITGLQGWLGRKPWTLTNDRVAATAVFVMDGQLLLGLVLYLGLSPLSRAMLADFSTAMHTHDVRFFGMEHPFLMVLATAVAHFGKIRSNQVPGNVLKHRAATVWYALSLLLMLIGTPWWRPLLRGF
jgi:hypothetical protein